MGNDDMHSVAIWGEYYKPGAESTVGFDLNEGVSVYRVPSKVVTSGKAPSFGLTMSRLMKNPVLFATFDAGKSD